MEGQKKKKLKSRQKWHDCTSALGQTRLKPEQNQMISTALSACQVADPNGTQQETTAGVGSDVTGFFERPSFSAGNKADDVLVVVGLCFFGLGGEALLLTCWPNHQHLT